jgi:RNA polymerase sigma-70 factor, ECF subfamily
MRKPIEDEAEPSPPIRELVREHSAFVWRSLRNLGIRDADLEDMLQEVFLVVHRRSGEYEERNRQRAWIYSICKRVAMAQRRKVTRRREDISADVPEERAPATQLQSLEQREALALGHRLLSLLTAEQREIFMLYEVEQLPMAEIAAALGCPLQTAYSRLHAARRRVALGLDKSRGEGDRDEE